MFPGKRKSNNIASAILENREIAEKEKRRRHEERMDAKFKIMEKIDKILEKL